MMSAKRAAVVLLTALLLLCAAPVSAGSARPSGIDPRKIREKTTFVSVQINDMIFIGKMRYDNELTEEEIDKLIKEALKESGLTESEFNELADRADGLTQQQLNELRDAFEVLAAPVPYLGNAASAVKILDQMDQGDYWGATKTLAEALGAVPMGMKLKSDIESLLKGIAMAFDTDRLTDFYDRLGKKLAERKNGRLIIEIKDEKQTRPFDFCFSPANDERWTLNMKLRQAESEYQFEGDFTIDIEYDISKCPEAIREKYQSGLAPLAVGDIRYDVAPVGYGSLTVNRRLKGKAYAQVSPSLIAVTQWSEDKKSVNVDPIFVYYDCYWGGDRRDGYTYTLEFDENNIQYTYEAHNNAAPGKYTQTYTWADFGDIHERADNAKTNEWKLRVVNHYH